MGPRETHSCNPDGETADRPWMVRGALLGMSGAPQPALPPPRLGKTCQKRDIEAEPFLMSGVNRLGEESVPGRGHSSAKAPRRETAERTEGPGRLLCLEPGESRRSAGPDGEGLTKRQAKGSGLHSENTGEPLRSFKQGVATDRFHLRKQSLWLKLGGWGVAGEAGRWKSVAARRKGSCRDGEKRPPGKVPQSP